MSTLGFASTLSAARPAPDAKILIRGARQVVTLQGPARMRAGPELQQAAVLRDASLLIERGRIVQVGNARRLDNLSEARAARWIDARHLVVLPGFVDASGSLLPLEGQEAYIHPEENADTEAWARGTAVPSRRISQELMRLTTAGSTFVRARFPLPEDLQQRGRMVRHLLRAEVPADAFQAVLQVEPVWFGSGIARSVSLRELFPPSARQHLRELFSQVVVEVAAGALQELNPAHRFHLLRGIARERPLQVAHAAQFGAHELLELGVAAACLACGDLPSRSSELERLAHLAQPWLLEAGVEAVRGGAALGALVQAVRAGMRLAVATGYQAGQPGVLSPLALLALLRQQTGIGLQELLNLQIANAAHAFGVGQRMGSLEVGKEANLLLLDCDDYREIGLAAGAPRIGAVLHRGRWAAGGDHALAREFGEH